MLWPSALSSLSFFICINTDADLVGCSKRTQRSQILRSASMLLETAKESGTTLTQPIRKSPSGGNFARAFD